MRSNREQGAPDLLAMFAAGSLTVVAVVVAVAKLDTGWADAVAIALVVGILAVLGLVIARELDDDQDP